MKIITIANHKGGVGKSNTAINLGASLAMLNRRVLIIDMDPQGNTSRGFGIDTSLVKHTIFDVLINRFDINKAIQHTCVEHCSIIPSQLIVASREENPDDRYFLLKDSIALLRKDYDYIIIDCPPSLGFLTMNCLAASDSVIIPIQCEYFALNAVTQILAKIANVQSKYNPDLAIEGVLLTMYDSESELDNQIAKELQNIFRENVYGSRIPRSHSIPESNIRGIPVVVYRPSSRASIAYNSLAKELVNEE